MSEAKEVTDKNGRKIGLRELDPMDFLDLLEAAGKNSGNSGWVSYASVVCSVSEIDGVPVPMPKDVNQIRQLGKRLGNAGITAVSGVIYGDGGIANEAAETVETAKN